METMEAVPPLATPAASRFNRRLGAIGAAVMVGVLAPAVSEAAPARAASLFGASFEVFGYPNGDVTGLADDSKDHLLAVSGDFDRWTNPDGTSKPVDKLAIVDDRTGVLKHRIDSVHGYVRRVVFTNNTFYAGGNFSRVDGQVRENLAAIHPTTGKLVQSWHPSAAGEVRTLATSYNRIYVGGYSSAIDAFSARGGAKHLWRQQLQTGAAVNTLLATGKNVYAGGSFDTREQHSRYGLVKLLAASGRLVKGFRDRSLLHPGGTCAPAHHPEWRESCKDIVLSLAKSRFGNKLMVGTGGIRNKYLQENSVSGKKEKEYAIVGDDQAVTLLDTNGKRSGETAVLGFHRNSNNNHGHPLDRFTAFVNTATGKFVKLATVLRRLDGGTANDDGNNGGVGIMLQANGRLYVGGGFSRPHDGLEVVALKK